MKTRIHILVQALIMVIMSSAAALRAQTGDLEHYFRAAADGNWDDVNIWEISDDNIIWRRLASLPPDNRSFTITIPKHRRVTIQTDVTVDELRVYGALIVTGSLTVVNGPGVDMAVGSLFPISYGAFEHCGNIDIQEGAQVDAWWGYWQNHCTSTAYTNANASSFGSINNRGEIRMGIFTYSGGSVGGNSFLYNSQVSELRLNDQTGTVIDVSSVFWPTTNGPANVNMSGNVTLKGTRTVRDLYVTQTFQIDSTGALITQGGTNVLGILNVRGMYTNTGTLRVGASGVINNLREILIEGTFDPGTGSLTGNPLRYGANGSLHLTSGLAGYVIDNSSLFWPITNGPANVSISTDVTLNGTRTVRGLLRLYGPLRVSSAGALTTPGTTEVLGGPLHVVGMYTNTGTLQVSGVLQIAGTFTNNGTTQIAGTFQIDPGGAVVGNTIVYTGCCSKLLFNDSRSIDSGSIFWPSANGPANLIVPKAFSVTLNAARTLSASLQVLGVLQVADTRTVNGPTQIPGTLEATGTLITNGDAIVFGGTLRVPGTFRNNAALTSYGTFEVAGTFINLGTAQIYNTLQMTGTLTNEGTIQIIRECQVSGIVTNNGNMQVEGMFQLDQGGSASGNDFIYGSSGTFVFNHSSGSYSVDSGDIIWPSTSGPWRVIVQGPGGIAMNVARALQQFETAAAVTNADSLTVSGTVAINAGGFFDSPPTYNGEIALIYGANGSYDVGMEWGSGTAVGANVPLNVIIGGGATVNMPNSPRTCPGDIYLSGTLVLSTTAGADLSVGGDWYNDVYNPGTLVPNSRAVIFNGTEEQTLRGVTTFDDLTVDNPFGISVPGYGNSEVQESDAVTVQRTLAFLAGNIRLGAAWQSSLILSGSVRGASASRHVVTYEYGRVERSIAADSSFQFPIGPTASSYNPLTIALAPADTTETFSVRVDSTVASDDSLFVQRTWDIQEATPGDNHAALRFQWAGVAEGAKFIRNVSSTYLNNVEVARNSAASGTDPYFASTTPGFPCTEFSSYTVGTPEIVTAVEERGSEIPTVFMLGQNYPNPFNPVTTIQFSVPSQSHVRLKVYNSAGNEVATLADRPYAPGTYQVNWDASRLASGFYFYRLKAEGFAETKQLLLMK